MWLEFNGDTVLQAARSGRADVHVDGDGYWSKRVYNKFREESLQQHHQCRAGTAGLAAVVISVIFTITQTLGVLGIYSLYFKLYVALTFLYIKFAMYLDINDI